MENSQNTEPLVSICIPVYNGEKTIRKTIDSIITQTYKNLEIIIVDNCSTDSTVKIVQEFKDSRIRLIQNEIFFPHGADNFNRCFQYVNGEFTAIFHADDVYLPNMVARQVETFIQFSSIGGVFTQGDLIDENDEIIGAFELPEQITGNTSYSYKEILIPTLEFGDFLPCPSAMIRTELYKKLAPFRTNQYYSAVDLDMWLRAAKCAPIIIINETLMNYRISKTQGTHVVNWLRTDEADFFKVCDFHIAQNQGKIKFPIDVMHKYYLSKLEDALTCCSNYLRKEDVKGCIVKFSRIPWLKYLKESVINIRFFDLDSYRRILGLIIRITIRCGKMAITEKIYKNRYCSSQAAFQQK